MEALDDVALQSEQALVRSGWDTLDLLGMIGAQRSKALLSHRWDAERERGAQWFRPLRRPEGWTARSTEVYETPNTLARFRRTLDFVGHGDRVLEIGTGKGYTAGLFLRDGGAAAYLGIELDPRNVVKANEVLAVNGLDDRGRVMQGDLYDLDPRLVAEFAPTLVVCVEVLEHVDDPEKAVRALADALPPDADLLVSVPVNGRLESVWGHVSIFDADRTRRMIEDAGLHVHAVDVAADKWALILSSHRAEASPRAAVAAVAAVEGREPPPPRPGPRAFHRIDLATARPARTAKGVDAPRIAPAKEGVTCTVSAARSRLPRLGGHTGGLAFDVASARGLRLELDTAEADGLKAVVVDAYAGETLIARWRWDLAKRPPSKPKITFVFGEGRQEAFFTQFRKGDLQQADTVEVLAVVAAGSSPTLGLPRAATLH
ncbi:MAG TPA: class I SAM-dependent methyltransferase [Actinomycetes bacterium]|nr:class I SAM-dependent methyltransferase [Actinomycetes bacterium]